MTAKVDELELAVGGLTFSAVACGRSSDPVVVFVHGFPDTLHTFRNQLPAVAAAGFRAVSVALRGYEPGSQPADGDYSLMTLADDVVAWINELGVERAHLVGHDWGAVIAYVTAAQHGPRLSSVTTLAIPPLSRIPAAVRRVPRQLQRSWYMTWFQVRGLSPRSVRAGDWRLLRWLWSQWSPGLTMDEDAWASVIDTFSRPGVLDAALQYYRQNATPPLLLGLRSTPAMEPVPLTVPALILNGIDDGCMDRRLYEHTIRREDYPGGVRHEEVASAGHFLHLEQPETVNELLLDHLTNA